MKLSAILLLHFTALAIACVENAYKCKGPNGASDDLAKTKNCCDSLNQDTCYCDYLAEDFCDPGADNVQNFKDCCGSFQGYETQEC